MPTMRPPRKGVTMSQALAAAYASAPETEIILETFEFRHPLFDAPIRIVNDHESLTATLEASAPANASEEVEFQPCYFSLKRGAESDSGRAPELAITIGNVSQILVPYVERLRGSRVAVECTYRPYLVSDLSGPHIDPPITLTVKTISADMTAVTIRAGFQMLTNKRFPGVEYTAKNFPGLTAR